MKLVDCFMYFDEDLVLDIRLHTLFKEVDKFIIAEATKDHGLFNVYLKDDKYYYEIPDSLLGRDMLMVTRISKMAVSIRLSSHKMNEQVLRWEKRTKIFY